MPTAKEISEYRELHQVGLNEAVRVLTLRELVADLDRLLASATIEEKIDWMLNTYREGLLSELGNQR